MVHKLMWKVLTEIGSEGQPCECMRELVIIKVLHGLYSLEHQSGKLGIGEDPGRGSPSCSGSSVTLGQWKEPRCHPDLAQTMHVYGQPSRTTTPPPISSRLHNNNNKRTKPGVNAGGGSKQHCQTVV